MLPRRLYLYLKPLYSILGGSTTRADPFMKKPIVVILRWKPLQRWKTRSHLTLVLSLTNSHVAFCNIYMAQRSNLRMQQQADQSWAALKSLDIGTCKFLSVVLIRSLRLSPISTQAYPNSYSVNYLQEKNYRSTSYFILTSVII